MIRSRLPAMDALIPLRLAKFVGVALLTTGIVGSILVGDQRTRRRAAQWLATAGLIVVWLAGYALLKRSGLTLREPWVSWSLLSGLVAMVGATAAARTAVVPPLAGALGLGGLAAAFGLMSARSGSVAYGLVVPGIVAAITTVALQRARIEGTPDPDTEDATFRWFAWLARAEGVSLLALFGVYMPVKYIAGVQLDGGQGWFGWAHGIMQLLYIVALITVARASGWSLLRQAVGFVASLVPFGTFVFESRVRPRPATASAPPA